MNERTEKGGEVKRRMRERNRTYTFWMKNFIHSVVNYHSSIQAKYFMMYTDLYGVNTDVCVYIVQIVRIEIY